MYGIKDKDYSLKIFEKIIDSIKCKFEKPESNWYEFSYKRHKVMGYKQLTNLSDDEKVEFVYTTLLIHGIIDTCLLSGNSYQMDILQKRRMLMKTLTYQSKAIGFIGNYFWMSFFL